MKTCLNCFMLACLTISTAMASAGHDVGNNNSISNLSCSYTQGYHVIVASIEGGSANIVSFLSNSNVAPTVIGGPYTQLFEYYEAGSIGIQSADGSFQLVSGNLTATLNDGSVLALDNLLCK